MTSSIEDSKYPIKNTKKSFSQKQLDISHFGLLIRNLIGRSGNSPWIEIGEKSFTRDSEA